MKFRSLKELEVGLEVLEAMSWLCESEHELKLEVNSNAMMQKKKK